jgi:hypothetical protein
MYRLPRPATVELNTALHGPVRHAFAAGDVQPKSEQEQLALDHLVVLGAAVIVEDVQPARKPARARKGEEE